MGEVKGSAAKTTAAGAGKVDKAVEKAKLAAAAKLEKEKLAKQKEIEKAKAEKAKVLAAKAIEKDKAKAEKEKAKAEKAAAKVKDPVWVEQLDEKGQAEKIDQNKFPFPVTCSFPGCDQVRYVNQSGLLLVTLCKPHARKERRKRRMQKVRAKVQNYKAIVKEAVEKKMFPDAFLKKHGLK